MGGSDNADCFGDGDLKRVILTKSEPIAKLLSMAKKKTCHCQFLFEVLRSLIIIVDFLNKTGYTATPVACGWAGAVFELLQHLGRSSEAKDCKNIK